MYDDDYSREIVYDAPEAGLNAFMTRVFGWLFLGLLLTAATSFAFFYMLANAPEGSAFYSVVGSNFFIFAMIILELVLVIALSRSLGSMSAFSAKLMYGVYAIVNGVTISYIVAVYAGAVVFQAFLMAAVFFGVMCLYGYITKADLTSVGRIMFVGLIAIIIASVINLFMRSGTMDFIICLVGLAIFIGLTAFDVQKIKTQYFSYAVGNGAEMADKTAIFGALMLYLDFINMFLYVLRLLGRKK